MIPDLTFALGTGKSDGLRNVGTRPGYDRTFGIGLSEKKPFRRPVRNTVPRRPHQGEGLL